MPRPRKPVPPTQQEISREIPKPFDKRGNPNIVPNSNEIQTGIPFNRSTKLSSKSDVAEEFKVGLEDIDGAVFYYFNEVIKPYVIQNSERIAVPIIYSSPEKWKSFQKDGYYRDKNEGIMFPIIVIQRNNLVKDRTVSNKLDANHPNMYASFLKTYSKKNAYSNFNVLNNRIPSKQYNLTVIPSYVTIEYSCLIQTYYVEQLNKIVEAVEYASDSYWGDPEKFKFRAFIDSFDTTVESIAENNRFAKSTFKIRLRGYIIPETLQKDLTALKQANSNSKITIDIKVI